MKKILLISAVSAIVLLAAGLLIRTPQSDSLKFMDRNVEALSDFDGPHLMYIADCNLTWHIPVPTPIFFLSCGEWDPFMQPDKIYSCTIDVELPVGY